MEKYLASQYLAGLAMLKGCVENYDEHLWQDRAKYKVAAGQIAYHTAFFTNIYLSPSRRTAVRWAREVPRMENLGNPVASGELLSRADIAEFVDHIVLCLPKYLGTISVDSDCWPDWYSLSQLEFHINNLRHMQHHVGQLIERHRLIKPLSVPWSTFRHNAN